MWMAAFVLCQQPPRLCCLRGFRRRFSWSQYLCRKTEDEAEDQEGKMGASQPPEASAHRVYRLHYSPSSYHQPEGNSATSRKQKCIDEDYRSLSTLAPSLWLQSRRYRVNSWRRLSSAKNTHLHVAFNKDPDPKRPLLPQRSNPASPELKPDPRGFHKCRPEYASMSLDLSQRPDPVPWEDIAQLLQKVHNSKGYATPSHLVEFLTELSRVDPCEATNVKGSPSFVALLRDAAEKRHLFTDAQLLDVLRSFVWLNINPMHLMLGLYETELCRRAKQMTLHELLSAADLWRCLKRQVPQFLHHLYDLVPQYLGHMGTPELVQLLYVMGEGRWFPDNLIYPVQQLIMRRLFDLNPEEVGVVCLSLFKSKTNISRTAVTSLVDKAHSLVSEMSDFAIVNVLKYLRFSYLFHKAWMEAMAQEIPLRAPSMGISGLMHVTLACSALHYRNDDILVAVADRVPSQVSHCRSKDSCKLLWAFGTLRFLPSQSQSFYSSLMEAMRQKKDEFQLYPQQLLTGLHGLAFVSQFPEDLIALALSPDFVKLALASNQLDLKNDLLTLDGIVALELPEWTGPRLSRELKEEIAERLWTFAQKDVCLKHEVQVAESTLRDLLGGAEFVCKRMILPHTRTIDLEVHLDPSGEPVPVNPTSHIATLHPVDTSCKVTLEMEKNTGRTFTKDLFAQLTNNRRTQTPPPNTTPAAIMRSEEINVFDRGVHLTSDLIDSLTKHSRDVTPTKLAIQVANKNHHCLHSSHLLGLHAMKRRHLKLAGYKVVELSVSEWSPILRKSKTEKLAYMHCKVFDSL